MCGRSESGRRVATAGRPACGSAKRSPKVCNQITSRPSAAASANSGIGGERNAQAWLHEIGREVGRIRGVCGNGRDIGEKVLGGDGRTVGGRELRENGGPQAWFGASSIGPQGEGAASPAGVVVQIRDQAGERQRRTVGCCTPWKMRLAIAGWWPSGEQSTTQISSVVRGRSSPIARSKCRDCAGASRARPRPRRKAASSVPAEPLCSIRRNGRPPRRAAERFRSTEAFESTCSAFALTEVKGRFESRVLLNFTTSARDHSLD